MRLAPPHFAYRRPDAVGRTGAEAAAVVIVGGGPVGLTIALDLARRGQRSILLDEDDTVATGSRAICWAKRTLEIFARLGLGHRFLEKGVVWHRGRVFHRDREAYAFDLAPEQGHEYPAFVNLQQYYVEQWLVAACEASGLVELRWRNRVAAVENRGDGALLTVETPDGPYRLQAQWLLACDGARSVVREQLGLAFIGQVFRDRFLIADVKLAAAAAAAWPTERWFWFDPPFHPGQSVLLHKQPDDIWRIDFQLGWDADPVAEAEPAKVRARVAAMLGPDVAFTLEWISVYTFRCRRLERFRHGHTLFLGDAAHQVSPFGARGGNGGVQDADNLGWKLAAVLTGQAPETLLDSYDAERIPAADENIMHSTRSTDFITPKSAAAEAWRDAVLALSGQHALARPLVNSGRLSHPASHADSPLSTGDITAAPASDAPVLRDDGKPDWLLRHCGRVAEAGLVAGDGFTLVAFASAAEPAVAAPAGLARVVVADHAAAGALWDHAGLAARRWDAAPGDAVLLRPDQHVAARFSRPMPDTILAARARALGRG